MESKNDLYDWFRYWTNEVSSNKQKPLNITITQLDGKYLYKTKSKRLIKKWVKQHTLNTVKYKYCKVDMSKVSDFESCNKELTINYNLVELDKEAIKMASKEAQEYIRQRYHSENSTFSTTEIEDVLLEHAFDEGIKVGKEQNALKESEIRSDAIAWIQDVTKKSLAKENIELKEKCNWVNLKESPNNIPNNDREVFIKYRLCTTNPTKNYPEEYTVGFYDSAYSKWTLKSFSWDRPENERYDKNKMYAFEVLAWKETN